MNKLIVAFVVGVGFGALGHFVLNSPQKARVTPPVFSKDTSETIQPNRDREISVNWNSVSEAKAYKILLLDNNENIVRSFLTSETHAAIKDLPISEHFQELKFDLALKAISHDGAESPLSEKRPVLIKPYAKLIAPEITSVKAD